MTTQVPENENAKLARLADAKLQEARTERPDLVNHYTTCRDYWRSRAKQA